MVVTREKRGVIPEEQADERLVEKEIKEQVQYRISWGSLIFFLIPLALVFEFIPLPGVGTAGILLIAFILLLFYGVHFLQGTRLATKISIHLATMIGEVFLSVFPLVIIDLLVTFFISRAEDRLSFRFEVLDKLTKLGKLKRFRSKIQLNNLKQVKPDLARRYMRRKGNRG